MAIEPIRTILVDDEKLSADATMAMLTKFPEINVIAYIDNSPELMSRLPELNAELLILDIEMPYNNGMNVASFVNKKYPNIEIIFCTGHAYFAADCYDFEPVDFITKPINEARLRRAALCRRRAAAGGVSDNRCRQYSVYREKGTQDLYKHKGQKISCVEI